MAILPGRSRKTSVDEVIDRDTVLLRVGTDRAARSMLREVV
jgi:hypothetical protein